MRTDVINLLAGPGSGKSTLAAGLFYRLKMKGLNVELALEYAKDLTWEERFSTLAVQPYVFGKQLHRLTRLLGKVRCIITDSPLILGCYYGKHYPVSFRQSVVDAFNGFNNHNFFVRRHKEYNPAGRNQTVEQAKEIDVELETMLKHHLVDYTVVDGTEEGLARLTNAALVALGEEPVVYFEAKSEWQSIGVK
jgi:hypothetical protein